jgi:hypothetical protein
MSTEFTREDRYIVFKLSDVERYLTDADRAHLAMMKNEIDAGRDCANKPPFKGLIVESDWPEYEPTWKAIEARVTGAQSVPSVPDGWKLIPEKHPTFDLVDLRLADGSVLCGCVPQSDGDYWWDGPSGEVFIDPKYAPATHWRLAAAPEAKP